MMLRPGDQSRVIRQDDQSHTAATRLARHKGCMQEILEVVKAKLRWPQSRFMWSERDTHGGDHGRLRLK